MAKRKVILVIFVLIFLVTGGYAVYRWRFQFPEMSESGPKYNLTLHVINMANMKPVDVSLPIECFQKDTRKKVATKKTNQEGVVVFVLPVGSYSCKVERGIDWSGGIDVNLEHDTDLDLKVLSVFR